MTQSILTKIILGTIPSYSIYEDEWFKAFLDIRPIHPGHLLLVPKVEIDEFQNLPAPYSEKIFPLSQKIAKVVKEVTGCPRVGIAYVGFEVPHCHCHIIPLWGPMDLDFRNAKVAKKEDLQRMQEKILAYLAINQT